METILKLKWNIYLFVNVTTYLKLVFIIIKFHSFILESHFYICFKYGYFKLVSPLLEYFRYFKEYLGKILAELERLRTIQMIICKNIWQLFRL